MCSRKCHLPLKWVLSASLFFVPLLAQATQKPLTNEGVIKMVQGGLPESVVVSAIQSSPAQYEISPDALIQLKKAGVTQKEMNAMIAAQQTAGAGGGEAAPKKASAEAPSAAPSATSNSRWKMPSVTVLNNRSSKELPMEKTQLTETKTKPHSLAGLAGDSAVTQGIQAGVNDVAWDTAVHSHSAVGGSAVLQAGSIFGGMMGHKQPTVTYVWGIPAATSANTVRTSTPKFGVNFAKAPGVNPDEFAPEIVKLTPAQNSCRLVGATQGKEDARSGNAADWAVYSSFVEDRVTVNLEKVAEGNYKVSPEKPLLPGEYAVVLRPLEKDKKFAGADVARGQGPGLMFNAVWSFQVASDAE